jgi:hypothetical protein
MSAVFLSYSRVDSGVADAIVQILEELRVTYFRDIKDIHWGQEVEGQVHAGLVTCAAVLVVVSPASLESGWVSYEIGYGRALQRDVLPFVTHASLRLPTYLSRLNHVRSLDEVRDFFASYVHSDAAGVSQNLQATIGSVARHYAEPNCTEAIMGKWSGQAHQQRGPDGHPIDFDVVVELSLSDNSVRGTMSIEMPYRGRQHKGQFDVTGWFVGGRFVWVNYVASDSTRPHFGTIILERSREPEKLICEYTGYGALTNGVVSGYAHLIRV